MHRISPNNASPNTHQQQSQLPTSYSPIQADTEQAHIDQAHIEQIRQSVFISLCRLVGLMLLMLVAFLSLYAKADQTHFSTHFSPQVEPDSLAFSYQWSTHDGDFTLEFALPTAALAQMPATQSTFSNAMMQREIEVALLKYAKALNPKTGRVSIKRRGSGLEYGVKTRLPEQGKKVMADLSRLSETARAQYLSQHFYTPYTSPTGQKAIQQDHAKYAEQSAPHLLPVVEAIKAMQQSPNNPREFINIALSWIQSIPYNTLENRATSNGAGFVSPKDLLMQNQGDCDSKATLLAALMRAYSGGVNQKMVLLPKHALLAIAIHPLPDDKTVSQDGKDYVLLEAAGPAYFEAGEAADSTLMGIRNRQYILDTM
ncbi:hypothetical protein ACFO4O_09990 [Glaciecola siphonariae]|uniref:Transglutaminase-like domain-containing protein n=1 Tax=Glaciecola siphonariae TaxID=521012 RepID=A0ABV9LWG4_9ALTE